MNNYVICLDKSGQVICWGTMSMCDNYINQLYSISLDDVVYESYSVSERFSSFYEDYEVYNIKGTNVFLTLGEIKMVREGCQEETKGIKFIRDELDNLLNLTDVYNPSIIEELKYFRSFMDELFNIHAKYNMDNVFTNLDVDALHSSYQYERENQGLPVVLMK